MNIQVKVEKKSDTQRTLQVTVPAELVSSRLSQSYADVQKRAEVKGFRKGHVPLSMVKTMYGDAIQHDLYHRLIDESFNEALKQNQIRAIGQPQVEGAHDHHHHKLEDGQSLSYTATVEVLPEVEPTHYDGMSLKKKDLKVTDADVEKVIERLRESHADWTPIEEESHKAQKGESVDIEFKGKLEEEGQFVEKEGMSGQQRLELGSGTFIPGFEEAVEGIAKGETRTFKIQFPKDYHAPDFQDRQSEFEVTAHGIFKKDVPTLDDAFAKEAGYETLDDMRAKARSGLEAQMQQDVEADLKNQVIEILVKKNKFEVPAALVSAQLRQMMQRIQSDLKGQGAPDDKIQELIMKDLEALKERAETQVRAGLLLDAISKKEKLEVLDTDFDQEYERSAQQFGATVEDVRKYFEGRPEEKENLEFRIREDKTLRFITDRAKVK